MKHLDRGLEPPNDPPDTEFDGDKYLKWVADRFTPQDVFGLDVFEKPSIEFKNWYCRYMNGEETEGEPNRQISDEDAYQLFLTQHH